MKWEKYKKPTSPKAKKTLRAAARLQEEQIANKKREINILTTATLPIWNKARLKKVCDSLSNELGYHCSDYRIALICTELYSRRNSKVVPNRATLYNDDKYGYEKIGLVFGKHRQYQRFRNMAMGAKASLSYLMDISLRFYLHLAARIFYLTAMGIHLKSRWYLGEDFFIYSGSIKRAGVKIEIENQPD